jgi:ABC-type nitrate/sulfonate/bicarbonate transport system substrate-binding protein
MKKFLGALLVVFLFHASAHSADKIRIGYPDPSAGFAALPLGQKLGFFQEEGLQAEFIRINPTVGLAALVSGEVDYYTLIGPAVAAAIQGVPIKVVACYFPRTTIALIARPEFKSVKELRGKAIGLNTFGGNFEIIARLIFKHFGLDPDKELKFLALGVTEARFAKMKEGLIAATLGPSPWDFLAKKMGFVVLARTYELFNFPTSGLVASVKKLKERPDEIKRVIKAGIKAYRYIRQNREGTIQFMAESLKTDKEMATASYDSVLKVLNEDGSLPEDGLRLVVEEAKKAAKVNRNVSLNEVADLSILRAAQRELGITGK